MTLDLLLSLALFAFVASITPGPNNLMLMSSGMTFGLPRTIPHLLGVGIGFVVMVFAVGLGLDRLFVAFPVLHTVLKVVSLAWLLWLAWKIAHSGPVQDTLGVARPMTFLEAAAFQWVNPKAWFMALTATATYAPKQDFLLNIVIVSLVFGLVNLPCIGLWASFGSVLRSVAQSPVMVRRINMGMAALLVISLWPLVRELVAL